ncbi:LmeA family phospholipid-binding protein [Kitasatospora mediocidica]|uniref:LmeA family phospholipid-binding protein n=1 Tax=Kitasatospora mediocidica TaxID=58352 RepID=UPI00056D692D|nr:DUF2993 domain-containing protein [Kitasatospora mediocidica]
MRTLIKVLIGVVVLAGLLVGADRIALSTAQSKAADQLANRQGISGRPSVTIDGFPFLTQALDKKFDSVRLSANSVQLSGGGQTVQLDSFAAKLRGVRVSGDYKSATVDSGTGSGRLPYANVESLLGLDSRTTLGYGGPGLLKVSVQVLGQKVGTTVKLRTDGNRVLVDSVGDVPGVGLLPGVSSMVSTAIGSKSFTLQDMPVGLTLSQVTPEPDGLVLAFQGSSLQLAG